MATDPNAFTPGLMVLLREDNVQPLQWKTGGIDEVHRGADGVVRVVSVKTVNGLAKRTFLKICILPIDN